jgi:hypothetical protein
MGVYLCLGQPPYDLAHSDSVSFTEFPNGYSDIHQVMSQNGKIFVFLGEGKHKIKKKAEQIACENAIALLA